MVPPDGGNGGDPERVTPPGAVGAAASRKLRAGAWRMLAAAWRAIVTVAVTSGHWITARLESPRQRITAEWARTKPSLLAWPVVAPLVRTDGAIRGALRRSLQLRVVTITTVLSTILVGAFGLLVASM